MNVEIHNLFYRAPREPDDVRVKNSILHFNPHQPLCACLPTMCTQPNNTKHYMENTPITTIAMLPTPPCHRPDCSRKFVINNPPESRAHPPPGWDFPGERRGEVDHNNHHLLALSLSDCHTSMPEYLSMIEITHSVQTTGVSAPLRSRAVEV